MTQAPERIIEQLRRVRNLMENAGTEGEAAAAAAAYSRLLQKYNLDAADIPVGDAEHLDDTIYGDEKIDIQQGLANWRWKVDLVHKLSIYNFCATVIMDREDKTKEPKLSPRYQKQLDRMVLVYKWGKHEQDEWRKRYSARPRLHYMAIIGKRHNTEVVRFLYEVITRRLEELSKAYPVGEQADTSDFEYDRTRIMTERDQLRTHLENEHEVFLSKTRDLEDEKVEALHRRVHSRRGKEFGPRKSFLYGAVTTINERMRQQFEAFKRGQSGDASKALVVINTNAVAIQGYIKQRFGKLSSFGQGGDTGIGLDRKAYAEGQAAGKAIQFQQGVGGGKGGIGTRAIGSGR